MLPKSRRLRLTRDFERSFSQGRAIYGRFVKVRLTPSTAVNGRFAVVVSNKVSKRAVVRNRIRRRVWSVIRSVYLLVPPKTDIVIIAANEAAKADFVELTSDLTQLLTKRLKHHS